MGKRRRRRKSRKSVKAIVKAELSKNLEKYTLLNSIHNMQIPYFFYREQDVGSATQFVYSLTGGYHTGLQGPQLTQGNDPGMKSLFNLLPLNNSMNTLSQPTPDPSVLHASAAGMGGNAQQEILVGSPGVITDRLTTRYPGVAMLRGTECKLLNFHFRYQIDWSQLTQYTYFGVDGATEYTDALVRGTGQAVRLMVIETRRPLSDNADAGQQLSQQIFLQATVEGVQSVVGSVPVASQPASINSFVNYNVVKRVHWSKLIRGNTIKTQTIGRGSVKLQRKAHWQMIYAGGIASATEDELQYMGPFLYLVAWSSNYENIKSAEVETNYQAPPRPRISITSMLTLNDA